MCIVYRTKHCKGKAFIRSMFVWGRFSAIFVSCLNNKMLGRAL